MDFALKQRGMGKGEGREREGSIGKCGKLGREGKGSGGSGGRESGGGDEGGEVKEGDFDNMWTMDDSPCSALQ